MDVCVPLTRALGALAAFDDGGRVFFQGRLLGASTAWAQRQPLGTGEGQGALGWVLTYLPLQVLPSFPFYMISYFYVTMDKKGECYSRCETEAVFYILYARKVGLLFSNKLFYFKIYKMYIYNLFSS